MERLAVEMYARGLSTREIEAAFTGENGVCLLTRTAVSEVTESLWEEYEAFQARDLSAIPVLYWFLDGLYEPLRRPTGSSARRSCAWGITTEGHKVLLSLALGSRESHDAWLEFLRDLVGRGLPMALTITTDGAPGLMGTVSEVWPQSLRLRCWVHRMRNVLAKVPQRLKAEVKAHLAALRDAPSPEAGRDAAKDFLARYGGELSRMPADATVPARVVPGHADREVAEEELAGSGG